MRKVADLGKGRGGKGREGRGWEGRGREGKKHYHSNSHSSSTQLDSLRQSLLPSPDEFEEADKVAAGDCVQGFDGKPHRGRVAHRRRVLGQAIEDVPTR